MNSVLFIVVVPPNAHIAVSMKSPLLPFLGMRFLMLFVILEFVTVIVPLSLNIAAPPLSIFLDLAVMSFPSKIELFTSTDPPLLKTSAPLLVAMLLMKVQFFKIKVPLLLIAPPYSPLAFMKVKLSKVTVTPLFILNILDEFLASIVMLDL